LGSPGTCSAEKQEHHLAERSDTINWPIEPSGDIMDSFAAWFFYDLFFCDSKNPEVINDCKGAGNRSYALLGRCNKYVYCVVHIHR
jgi:hypothetical protein